MENKKLTFDTKIRCLTAPGFREISSRENDQWNLDVCKYFSFLGKACQSLGSAKSTLKAIEEINPVLKKNIKNYLHTTRDGM